MGRSVLRRVALLPLLGAGLLAASAAGHVPASAGEPPRDERTGNVFFTEPDDETEHRIEDLIGQFSTGSPSGRERARTELVGIGFWAVRPLIRALEKLEPPVRCAAALTIEGIGDRRAVEPLRRQIVEQTSHPYVAAFAALALGRMQDAGAVEPMAKALETSKSIHHLRAAVPFALARVRSESAKELLRYRVAAGKGREPVERARMVALGFFPDLALHESRADPSESLRRGFESKRRGVREAALLGYLVATVGRRDTRDFLLEALDDAETDAFAALALLGLSHLEDSGVTKQLADAATNHRDDGVRIAAADLLANRGDPSARGALLRLIRGSNPARLKAAAVLALSSIDDPEATEAVVGRISDKAALVRAAAAVGCTRFINKTARATALGRIDRRLRQPGESREEVRENMRLARLLLAGERESVEWRDDPGSSLFADLSIDYQDRLLREVNRAVQASLDLVKIHNLQTDQEKSGGGPPSPDPGEAPPSGGGDQGDDGGDGDTGGDGGDTGGIPGTPPQPGGGSSIPENVAGGAVRTSAYPELRDLKRHLLVRPYFGREDLPAGPLTSTPSER